MIWTKGKQTSGIEKQGIPTLLSPRGMPCFYALEDPAALRLLLLDAISREGAESES